MTKWLKYAIASTTLVGAAVAAAAFRCHHRNVTIPFNRRGADKKVVPNVHYVVCTECGKELTYKWDDMRVIGALEQALKDLRERIYADDVDDDISARDSLIPGHIQESQS